MLATRFTQEELLVLSQGIRRQDPDAMPVEIFGDLLEESCIDRYSTKDEFGHIDTTWDELLIWGHEIIYSPLVTGLGLMGREPYPNGLYEGHNRCCWANFAVKLEVLPDNSEIPDILLRYLQNGQWTNDGSNEIYISYRNPSKANQELSSAILRWCEDRFRQIVLQMPIVC